MTPRPRFTFPTLFSLLMLALPLVLAIARPAPAESAPKVPGVPQSSKVPHPPATLAQPVNEILHGVRLTDPYRWLEDQDAPATRRWIEAQNVYTRAILDAIPGREPLSRRLSELLRVDALGGPVQRGNRFFFPRRLAGQDLSVICLREGLDGPIQPLIDPHPLSPDHTVSVNILDVSEDGRTLVYGLRAGGQDEVAVRLFDVDRRAGLPGGMPRAWYSGISLAADGKGLFYSRLTAQGGRVYYHPLAADAESTASDTLLFGEGCGPEQFVSAGLSEDGRHLVIHVEHGHGRQTDIFVKDIATNGPIRPIVQGIDAEFTGQVVENTLYVLTNWQAPNRRILAVDLANPARESWRELVPERPGTVIDYLCLAGGRLFVHTMRDVITKNEIYTLQDGRALRAGEIAFPDLGNLSGLGGRWRDDSAFFSYESFHVPSTIYRFDVARGRHSVWFRPEIPFDSSQYETRQVWFASRDGARVPMFLSHRKGLKPSGNAPTLLTGYGGFNISRLPGYSAYAAAWLERGGVYAQPNLRGGSEFGEAWHRAGMLANKQNVFDDFFAAAQWLIDHRYTSPARLAISGRSNGGLLVGAALTQRPDLFRAVVCGYPLLDMVRYHKFLLGPLWVPEYGSPDDPAQFKTLLDYSPYHRVKPGTPYPAVLFVTGDADTRVAPLHARKMAALLQSATASGRPVLLRYETAAGHSGGRPLGKTIDDMTDELGFLFWQLSQ